MSQDKLLVQFLYTVIILLRTDHTERPSVISPELWLAGQRSPWQAATSPSRGQSPFQIQKVPKGTLLGVAFVPGLVPHPQAWQTAWWDPREQG